MKTKKSTILTFGDPHIDEKSIDELSITFDEIVKKYGGKDYTMIMLGDFYDKKRPTPLEILFGTKYTSIFKEKFKEVIFLRGNHDKTEKISSTDYLKYLGIKVVDDYVFDKMFFGHGMTNHSMMEYGTAVYKVKELEEKYKLSVLGHLHMFQRVTSKIFHPGSVRFCGFNEVEYPTKYVGIIKNRKIEFKKLDSVIPMKDVESIDELKKIDKRTKVRIIFNDWEQYKNEINHLRKLIKFIEPIKIKLDFKILAKKTKKVEKTYKLNKLLQKCLKEITDSEVKELVKEQFKKEKLL